MERGIKICKNCKWFFGHPKKISAQCMHDKEYSIDVVYGTIKWLNAGDYITCEESRKDYIKCSMEGKWFEER